MNKAILTILLLISISCKSNINNKENWIKEPFKKSKQALFINKVKSKNYGNFVGSAATLIEYNGITFGIAPKHILLGPGNLLEKGLLYEPYKTLETELISWKLIPRNNAEDEIECSFILKSMDYRCDIVLLSIQGNTDQFLKLKPRFTPPLEGETLYLIDCPVNEANCYQNKYKLISERCKYEDSFLVKFEDEGFDDIHKFSGAPVVDSDGNLIGLINMKIYDKIAVARLSALEGFFNL